MVEILFIALFLFRHFIGPMFFYSLFYNWMPDLYAAVKIQNAAPLAVQIQTEKKWTAISAAMDIIVFLLSLLLFKMGITKVYGNYSDHSTIFAIFGFLSLAILQDFYFYCTHRLMHHKKIFKYVHYIHHKSKNPTPWSAFSVHPAEKLLELLFFPLVIMLVPLHPAVILFFIFVSTLVNLLGHAGFEFNWLKIRTDSINWWGTTSTFHNMHHKYVSCNYSLYFSLWDKLLKTEHPNYASEYEAVCGMKPSHGSHKICH